MKSWGAVGPCLESGHFLDLVKFVMCTLESRLHLTFYVLTKGYTVPAFQGTNDVLHAYKRAGNQSTHDKINQIRLFVEKFDFVMIVTTFQ